MIKKLKEFWDKIDPFVFLILTSILCLVFSGVIFIYFKDVKLFNNNLLNLFALIIFFSAVYSFIINLYYKIFKFTLMKPSITKKEFNRLWKKRYKIALEFPRKIKLKSKKDKERWNKIKKITKKLDKNAIKFKSWFAFFIFSIYFGSWEGLFLWSIRNSTRYFLKAIKYSFASKPYGLEFKWYKLKGEYYYIIDSSIYPHKKSKSN